MMFKRTESAAKADRTSKWDLIEAIWQDATDNEVPVSGIESRLAAKAALDKAGNEQSDWTISDLCVVAKFDQESTRSQRQTWRRYGWTSVRTVVKAGCSHSKAFDLLGGQHLTFRQIEALIDRSSLGRATQGKATTSVDEALKRWVNRLEGILTEGAELAERAEHEDAELSTHAQLALLIYDRITEKKIDAELRDLLDSEDASRG